jgi:ring-1,2-phenylacetyl-CoA epoxidase subunit PaaC
MKVEEKQIDLKQTKHRYLLELADNSLILGQRLGELTGHGPTLEVDMALTNISLDLFGQVRSYFQYAAQLSKDEVSEDDLAFMRTERNYYNLLLLEQPNRNFAYVIARQFLYDHFHFMLLQQLQKSEDGTLVAIANKSIKESAYHKRFSSDWLVRLGDGTDESHEKIQEAIDELWKYTDEFFQQTEAEKELIKKNIAVDVTQFKEDYYKIIGEYLKKATLEIPELKYFQSGGKEGRHTEHLGFILTDLQYMQRTYPGMKW